MRHTIKKYLKRLKSSDRRGFTLLEMIIVLFVIAVLLLLVIPNIAQQRDNIRSQGDEALLTTYETQASLFLTNEGREANSIQELVETGYLSQDQADRLNEIQR
ncbi:competence type IV pilus major pilin ComGC [Aerococcus sanguinicola]|uniref:competence type IV pilus major pilin ComGC n=1 Tax=unclassified Aerococcus TaxID=2618060 RepID=UPI0008A1BA2B|nr:MULTISPECIES: competence type IV pilus major pilin ComGC [unclassified Aerococcus]MDK6232769.1 competence type IV pilus major pilin ComGC [Aerococcus sp. UMB10185]MDK6805282.1 competence type IV pilus major pilin ComGC [Aerococcus sp. UMB7834]MDK6854941.1 competence type IV pilus major pilin ComGC [Aerococcus sp. UMB7533]MDK8501793.1 competence type IV pilus major pilin ComGC [Aerococcus sp. UMB1112A]OFN02699.1 hypothetical protein HMPREF2626_01960 [Aerococcus sp. HMSC062A02]